MDVMAFHTIAKLGSVAAVAAVLCAAPAMAQTSTNLSGGTQQQPTSFLGTDTAYVLQPGLQYVTGGVGSLGFNYGMAGGELNVDLTGVNITPTFGANLGLGYKMPLTRGVAFSVGGDVNGIGGTLGLAARVGLPMTWELGGAWLSFSPALNVPSLTTGTAGTTLSGNVGVQAPFAKGWSALVEVVPTYAFTGGALTVAANGGLRLSPSATTAVDFRLGSIPLSPGGGAAIGLASVTGHVGFF